MFQIDLTDMKIEMHRGDTGAWKVNATKSSGAAWSEHDRMIFTVSGSDGTVRIKRVYRLDADRTETDLGDGVVQIELHNDDTDEWPVGQYTTELRFVGNAVWDGEELTSDCVDDLTSDSHIIEGVPVRTTLQSSLNIRGIIGEV